MVGSRKLFLVLLVLFLLCVHVPPVLCEKRVILTQSEKDIDLDGVDEIIAVEMVSGDRVVETEPGPFTGERFEGFFKLVVRKTEGESKSLLLNPLFFPEYPDEPMLFMDEQWEIHFTDYNADGRPDCNLGQYAGSNGNVYIIVAFSPSGQPYVMPFEGRPRGIFAADSEYSSAALVPLTGGGVVFEWYDNTRGVTVRETWVWDQLNGHFFLQSTASL